MQQKLLVLPEEASQPDLADNEVEIGFTEALTEREIHRALGFVPTPLQVVSFMTLLAAPSPNTTCSVLEPACADARFLTEFMRRYGTHHAFTGVEINPQTTAFVRNHIHSAIEIIHADFLLWDTAERFDVIIGNPPYGIVGDASHYPIHLLRERKEEYKKRITTWKGKYNIYGAFIEKAVHLLKPNGKLIFIVPTTWLILDDFVYLRRFLAEHGRIEVFYVGRVFPRVNVSAVVLRFIRGERGLALYDTENEEWHTIEVETDIRMQPKVSKTSYSGQIIRFETPEWLAFERSGNPLGKLFQIHFAARSPEFRRSGLVHTMPQPGFVPVLTGRNLLEGQIDYDNCYSGWWMRRQDAPRLRKFYAEPHLVVGHTKGVRLVCAVDWRCYPWREEYHLTPVPGTTVDWLGLQQYLNSERIQMYLQTLYRDFTPHLTKTMLEQVPVPEQVAKPAQGLKDRLPLFEEESS